MGVGLTSALMVDLEMWGTSKGLFVFAPANHKLPERN